MEICFHCGDECSSLRIEHQQKNFCCHGCKTVFDMLQENNLSYYYDLVQNPGNSPGRFDHKFDFLQNESIAEKLLQFNEQGVQRINLSIPSIHCSSCIWVLENLHKLNSNIKSTQVNFPQKKLSVTYKSEAINLHQLVLLLCNIGYEPYISLDDTTKKSKTHNRNLIYKLGVAGFAFGNIMFLSFPEYFEVNEFWLERYKYVFRWLMFAFSLPVVFYSAQDYIISAYKSLVSKTLNIDVPIALGIVVLFLRSTLEIVMDWGTGFLDSLAGLIFFLLLGKFFQQKTYAYLSFDRDYKSYFPVAVTRLSKNQDTPKEEQISVSELEAGDRILIRNAELLPVDGILIKGHGLIDYSFVTGEAEPVAKQSGDLVYAGGRQQSSSIEIEVTKSVEKSYLTQLWSNETFSDKKVSLYQNITDQVSKNFTISIVALSLVTTLFWLFYEPALAFNVFTAILIVACPCAIALAAPFTLGNMLRIFGRNKLYLKNSNVIEELAEVDTVVFDKTGTLTINTNNLVSYEGIELSENELSILTSTLRASNHPLSRSIYEMLKDQKIFSLDEFTEDIGQGIKGTYRSQTIKVGSLDYVVEQRHSLAQLEKTNRTAVYVSSNNSLRGCYVFQHQYREGVSTIFESLGKTKEIMVLSGDNDGERQQLSEWLPKEAQLVFNQKPKDKLEFIKQLQESGKRVLMIGDGLNDAGALAQSDVGIAISENINVFSPACDGILDASRFKDLVSFISLSRKAKQVIKYAFIFSLFYNLIGLGFAITGNLQPVVAAILMPLSSISIVVFTSLYTYLLGKQLNS